ncbi:MAG: O-antigen ligase family protein [Bacteroidales bacterium]|nr:O-antigen ligase family protein [Bacteroidales bacterium]
MSKQYTTIQNIQYFFACLFFASLNFEVFSPFVEHFSVAKMAAFLYLGVSIFTPKSLFWVRDLKTPLISVWSMFFLMVLSSIIHVQNQRTVFDTTLFLNLIMFWLLLNHQRRDERVFNEGLLWFSVSSFVVGVFFFMGVGVSISEDMRVVVFGENANGLGIKMGVGTLFLMNYCLNHSKETRIYRPWLLLMAIPMVSLLLATASRVSILILGVGLVLFVILRSTKRKGLKPVWLILGIFVLYFGYHIVLKQEVLMMRMELTLEEGSTSGRDYIWAKYLDLIEQHPVLGVGFSGADSYALSTFGGALNPHNVFIEVALYSGLLGLVFFLVFVYCIYHDAWQFHKKENNLGPLVTSMAAAGMLLTGQALNVKLFWVLAAYAISYRLLPHCKTNHQAE